MPQLTPVELEDGTIIMLESTEDVEASSVNIGEPVTEEEEPLVSKGGLETAIQKFNTLEGTIRSYTNYTLNAFKEVASANVDKVTLEFGIKVGGEAGIPYVTKGTAESNLKITVECSFPEKSKQKEMK